MSTVLSDVTCIDCRTGGSGWKNLACSGRQMSTQEMGRPGWPAQVPVLYEFMRSSFVSVGACNCRLWCDLYQLQDRWQWLEEFVMQRRADERKLIDQARAGLTKYQVHYEYQAEPFSIRRKDFWPLWKAKSILQNFIPTLSHESDGLIFQVC